jgi:hypothetical protein
MFCWRVVNYLLHVHMPKNGEAYGGLYIPLKPQSTVDVRNRRRPPLRANGWSAFTLLPTHMYIRQELVHLHSALDQIEEEAT